MVLLEEAQQLIRMSSLCLVVSGSDVHPDKELDRVELSPHLAMLDFVGMLRCAEEN
jgi:hypothetical protein